MTILDCSVTGCMYNEANCCHNLPLRFLFYMSDLYSKITKDANLYGEKKVKIPAAEVLRNVGTDAQKT